MPLTEALVDSVLDGNTIEITLGIDIDAHSTTLVLARVYAPPLTILEGREAKRALKGLINRRHINYKIVGTGTRDTYIAEVWLNKVNVNDWMVTKGYGRKINWSIEPDWKAR